MIAAQLPEFKPCDTCEMRGTCRSVRHCCGPAPARTTGDTNHMHWAAVAPDGTIEFAASMGRDFMHDHIKDALCNGVEDAKTWVVRPIYIGEPQR